MKRAAGKYVGKEKAVKEEEIRIRRAISQDSSYLK
jgi:hypothetical protein